MGPEESTEKVKLYMMVDGKQMEIAPEIAETKLPEGKQGGDVLPMQECEITVQVERPPVPLVHGRMIYRCEQCGRSWAMFLEKGIEEFRENHKPSPFTIGCPYCGGWAMDVSGIQKIPGGYIPLPGGGNYFANTEDKNCGVPVFCEERLQESNETQAVIADALASMKSREMEMCRETMRKELDRVEEIVSVAMPDEVEAIKKTSVIIAKKAGVALEEAVGMVLIAIQDLGESLKTAFALGRSELEEFEALEREQKKLNCPTARDRKEAREKQHAVERAASSRFRQYKTRESAWSARKRTGPRRREWRGPRKEG